VNKATPHSWERTIWPPVHIDEDLVYGRSDDLKQKSVALVAPRAWAKG
jgi:hypothetical protein